MIIRNKDIREKLKKIVDEDKVTNSYIFSGINGIGKKQIAFEFAKYILCRTRKENCCCKSCLEFENHSHMDFEEISKTGQSIKISQVREFQTNLYELPTISNNRIIVIDEAEKMTTESQNALLKTLEEAPSYVIIILVTSDKASLLDTIKSRCITYDFEKLTTEDLKQFVEENVNEKAKEKKNQDKGKDNKQVLDVLKNAGDLKINYRYLDGSISNLLNYVENYSVYSNLDSVFENINKISYSKYLELTNLLYEQKENISFILNYMNNLVLEKAKTNNLKFAKCVFIIEEVKQRLRCNGNYDMAIDKLLFDIWGELR